MDTGSIKESTCTIAVGRETGIDIDPMELDYKYFVWLCGKVGLDGSRYTDCSEEHIDSETSHLTFFTLGHILYSIPFKVLVPHDDNRASDGMQLRHLFSSLGDGYKDVTILNKGYCTVLEMLIGLSVRMDGSIVSHPDFPWENRMTTDIFWMIMNNLGIHESEVTDSKLAEIKPEVGQTGNQVVNKIFWIKNVVEKANNREYDRCGNGSFFPLKHPQKNPQNQEIWDQMSAFVVERNL